jgi:SAM-dependent methyltransferase
MKEQVLQLLRCPHCRATLVSGSAEQLSCTRCESIFPIVNGIPRFVPPENYATNFGFQWNHFRQTQLDSHTGRPISRTRFLEQTGWDAEQLRGKRVLDAGCGAGRFAEVALSLGAEVFAIDYSSAVDAAASNLRLGENPRLHIFQADIYSLPFADESFEYVYSLGVLQHTPDVQRALRALIPFLKPGGKLTVDLYLRNLARWAHPRTWLRPVTVRMPGDRLFQLIQRWAPRLLAVSRAFQRVPLFGRYLSRAVPVANYHGVLPLDDHQLREWAILDTFDWLAPRYDQPQTPATLRHWLADPQLTGAEVFRSHHLTGRAVKRSRESAG